MKKLVLTSVVVLLGIVGFAQNSSTAPQRLKYVTTGPDGSVAMTVVDDSVADNIKLESADNFYKYEILEPTTSEAIYRSDNKGKQAIIDKDKLAAGTYNLRLYTASFVITSKITITASRKMRSLLQANEEIIASND
ncbi:MAG: hypothetical protein OEW87_06870 [Flavobacteriaceae bacterium]|nr:hypothetical protein [Flavobacteriaceae bacterium]